MYNVDMAQYTTTDGARIGILMGSASDWPTMKKASDTLKKFGVAHECNAISAHRNPERLQNLQGLPTKYQTTKTARNLVYSRAENVRGSCFFNESG